MIIKDNVNQTEGFMIAKIMSEGDSVKEIHWMYYYKPEDSSLVYNIGGFFAPRYEVKNDMDYIDYIKVVEDHIEDKDVYQLKADAHSNHDYRNRDCRYFIKDLPVHLIANVPAFMVNYLVGKYKFDLYEIVNTESKIKNFHLQGRLPLDEGDMEKLKELCHPDIDTEIASLLLGMDVE